MVFHQSTAVIIITSYRISFFLCEDYERNDGCEKAFVMVQTALGQGMRSLLKPHYFHRESAGGGLYTLRKNE
jgi:hypothetical protein